MFERYSEMLKERGVKNIDVSRATGIPASTFSDWKKGKSSPKKKIRLKKLLNSLKSILIGCPEHQTSKPTKKLKKNLSEL